MFCTVRGLESSGVGKVIDADGPVWTVEYFDGPALVERETLRVNKSHVVRKKIGANTRVYYSQNANGHWLVGRVLEDVGDGVEVRFSGKTDVSLKYDELFVRSKRPISDPVDFLAHSITETPLYSQARSKFLDCYIAQRRGTGGISALLSSAIELNPHQVDVVRRVLSDASQRYLLADEVGLGKTIEAGVIIRQAVLDDPKGHKVVVLVPKPLVPQWRQELVRRFGLEIYLDDSVLVVPQEPSKELKEALEGANMLVVDEAHHLASSSKSAPGLLYEMVSQAAKATERLLLLSATPVLRNEVGFLRMLHLIDPVVYDLADENSFRAKILHRQALAEAVATLVPQNVLHLEPVLDDLVEKLPSDGRLLELVGDLRMRLAGIPDANNPELNAAVRILRAHLSETYRLHRRILRNRRKHVKWLTPNRRGSVICWVPRNAQWRCESALENWRISAIAFVASKGQESPVSLVFESFYCAAIQALLEDPTKLERLGQSRLTQLARTTLGRPDSFEGEANLLIELVRSTDELESYLSARAGSVGETLRGLIDKQFKVVVFCSEKEVADFIFDHVNNLFPLGTVVRHEVVEVDEFDQKNPAWFEFQVSPTVQVIVCDRRAEEGINLQGGRKAIIHFDLPFDPNRIEQRIGRLDRYCAGDPVQSIVVLDDGSPLQFAWYSVLCDGLGIFDRSTSSLQYLVEEQLRLLRGNLFRDGVDALSDLATALGGSNGLVNKELRLIEQQDGLDELAPQLETDLDAIFDVDDSWREIREATHPWAVDTLMFSQFNVPLKGRDTPVDPPFRFRYSVPGSGGPATLIPLSGFLDDFIGALDYEAPGANSRQPLSFAHSYHRKSAIKYGVRPLRYGCEFIEALKSFSDLDDRGRTFACWRYVYRGPTPNGQRMYFRFSFLICCNLEPAITVIQSMRQQTGQHSGSSVSRRADALFPPRVEHVWVDEDGDEPDAALVEKFLAPSYDKNGTSGRYVDTNLKTQRLQHLIENLPDVFGNWKDRCVRMRNRALAILTARQELAAHIRAASVKARLEQEIRYAQLQTRIQQLDGREAVSEREQLVFERKLSAALDSGIVVPSIEVDVAGMIFLASEQYASAEQPIEGRA